MKAIYEHVGDKYYFVRQQTEIPRLVEDSNSGLSSNVTIDSANKIVTQSIKINTLKRQGVESNAELYREMIDFIKENDITEIKELQNFFKIYIDYSVFENGHEVEHSALVKPINSVDKIVPLGVATNNENVFRRVKTFDHTVEFKIRTKSPYGVMAGPRTNYIFQINNIVLFQDTTSFDDVHQSMYEVPYKVGSPTIQSSIEDMLPIYSTLDEETVFTPVTLNYVPRQVRIKMNIVMANICTVYDKTAVDDVIISNIEEKYEPEDPIAPEDPEDPGILYPDEDKRPDADGDYEPDENGYFNYYERCGETTPNSILVVEDLIPDNVYDITSMIKKSKVILDIPDIEVGDYVVFRESFETIN